jgi:hypothetical protein
MPKTNKNKPRQAKRNIDKTQKRLNIKYLSPLGCIPLCSYQAFFAPRSLWAASAQPNRAARQAPDGSRPNEAGVFSFPETSFQPLQNGRARG